MHEHETSRRRLAVSATLHCLTGCGIGEVLGLVIADALGWTTVPAIALAVVLAFIFGYSLTLQPLLRGGVALGAALGIAFAADTLGATLALALALAFVAAFPVNYWLLGQGKGHALVHEYH